MMTNPKHTRGQYRGVAKAFSANFRDEYDRIDQEIEAKRRQTREWEVKKPSKPVRLPAIVGIGKHIFVSTVDRGKWRVEILVQVDGEPHPQSAFFGMDIMQLDCGTRDKAQAFRDQILFELANRTPVVLRVFLRSGGMYPNAEIRNGWSMASPKGADSGRAFKEPERYGMVDTEVKP